jgi:hypothetical protein
VGFLRILIIFRFDFLSTRTDLLYGEEDKGPVSRKTVQVVVRKFCRQVGQERVNRFLHFYKAHPKKVDGLIELYLNSVGQNCLTIYFSQPDYTIVFSAKLREFSTRTTMMSKLPKRHSSDGSRKAKSRISLSQHVSLQCLCQPL